MKAVRVALLAATLAALAAGTSFAAPDYGLKIGEAAARGEFAGTNVSGQVVRPTELRIRVVAKPPQPVEGSYSIVCEKGDLTDNSDGNFEGEAPFVRRLPMPYARPDYCPVVVGYAQLQEGGKLKLELYAKYRRSRPGR